LIICCTPYHYTPTLVHRLCQCIQEALDVLQDSLDILVEVLGRFGHYVQDQHQALLATLLPHLDDHRQGVRKRALQAVGERCML
jgi:hypothetical protein